MKVQVHLGPGRLGIGEHHDARRVVFGNVEAGPVCRGRDGGARLRGLTLGRRREVLPDLRLDQLGIEIAHCDDGHQVGPVPALVVVPETLHRGRLDHLGQADRVAVGVARGAEHRRDQGLPDARVEPLPQPPLLQDDVALQLHLFGCEAYRVRPVAEDLEGGLEDVRIVGRNLEPVQGVVVAGLGVQVGTEGAADRLEVFDDLLLGEALGAVERHVFHEMRQPALVLFLEDGACPQHQR